jgi:hypothetical protein
MTNAQGNTTNPRDSLAALIRHHYQTEGDSQLAAAAETGLMTYDALLLALCLLVGGMGHEGDLYSEKAHALARATIKEATGN